MTNNRELMEKEKADLGRLSTVPVSRPAPREDGKASAEVVKEIIIDAGASHERASGPELSGTSFSFEVEKKQVRGMEERLAKTSVSPSLQHDYHDLQHPQDVAAGTEHASHTHHSVDNQAQTEMPKTVLDRLVDWLAGVLKSFEKLLFRKAEGPVQVINPVRVETVEEKEERERLETTKRFEKSANDALSHHDEH